MCLSSVIQNNSQIDRYVENGMPQKIIKTVEYTLRKRAAELHKLQTLPLEQEHIPLKIPKMCGRFREMQLQDQNATLMPRKVLAPRNMENSCTVALALGTQIMRKCLQKLNVEITNLQHYKLYTLLTKTTQPAHLVAVCILVLLMVTVGPHLIENHTNTLKKTASTPQYSMKSANNPIANTIILDTEYLNSTIQNNRNNKHNENYENGINDNNNNTLAMILYLGAFATHFGAQIWMTFVSGLSLYFSLPRHTFGQCQQILFPKYFALNAILSITMLILFVIYFTSVWTTTTCIQFAALVICVVIEVTIRLYLAPPMLLLMHEKYKIEGAIGSGQEVGTLVQGDLAQCPHYQRIHKMFRRIHMTIACGNMIVLLATCLQLYFLAIRIQIS